MSLSEVREKLKKSLENRAKRSFTTIATNNINNILKGIDELKEDKHNMKIPDTASVEDAVEAMQLVETKQESFNDKANKFKQGVIDVITVILLYMNNRGIIKLNEDEIYELANHYSNMIINEEQYNFGYLAELILNKFTIPEDNYNDILTEIFSVLVDINQINNPQIIAEDYEISNLDYMYYVIIFMLRKTDIFDDVLDNTRKELIEMYETFINTQSDKSDTIITDKDTIIADKANVQSVPDFEVKIDEFLDEGYELLNLGNDTKVAGNVIIDGKLHGVSEGELGKYLKENVTLLLSPNNNIIVLINDEVEDEIKLNIFPFRYFGLLQVVYQTVKARYNNYIKNFDKIDKEDRDELEIMLRIVDLILFLKKPNILENLRVSFYEKLGISEDDIFTGRTKYFRRIFKSNQHSKKISDISDISGMGIIDDLGNVFSNLGDNITDTIDDIGDDIKNSGTYKKVYKIVNDLFHDVPIDGKLLKEQMRLKVEGKGIDKMVDKDTVDILTKRFINKPYSDEAIKNFQTILQLSNHPVNMNSKKHIFDPRIAGKGSSLSSNINDTKHEVVDVEIIDGNKGLVNKLSELLGHFKAGGNNPKHFMELREVLDHMRQKNIIDNMTYKNMYNRYGLSKF